MEAYTGKIKQAKAAWSYRRRICNGKCLETKVKSESRPRINDKWTQKAEISECVELCTVYISNHLRHLNEIINCWKKYQSTDKALVRNG